MSFERVSFRQDDWQTDPSSYDNMSERELMDHRASLLADLDAATLRRSEHQRKMEEATEEIETTRAVLQALQEALEARKDTR